MANCDKMKLNYSNYIEGELPADQSKALDEHLNQCPECRETVRQLRIIKQSLKQLPEIKTSPDFEQKLQKQIFQQSQRSALIPPQLQNWKIPAMGSAIVLATLGLFLVLNDSSAPDGSTITKPENLINNAAPQFPGKKNVNFSEDQSSPVYESTTRIMEDSLRSDSIRINPEGIQQVGVK
jgi:anti-sigma factor RsiW